MFIVKRRADLLRFGLFLLLMGALVWFVLSRFAAWRLSEQPTEGTLPTASPIVTAEWPYGSGFGGGRAGDARADVLPASGAGFSDVSDGGDYFAEFRIDRERTRGALGDRLKEVMASRTASTAVQQEATQQYLLLGQTIALEAQAEAMVKARGYDDVIVNLAEGSAQVVVKAPELSHQQVAQIMDTVSRITGVKAAAITVVAKDE